MEGICHLIQELGRSSTILCSWVCLFELVDTAVCGAKSGKMEMKSLKSGNFFLFLVELHFFVCVCCFSSTAAIERAGGSAKINYIFKINIKKESAMAQEVVRDHCQFNINVISFKMQGSELSIN